MDRARMDTVEISPMLPLWRMSVAQYQAMIAGGILTEDDNIELLEGLLVAKMTKNRPHSLSTGLVRKLLEAILPAGWFVDSQEPITTGDSQPEPDGVVVRGQPRDYQAAPPPAEQVGLVIEVSDSSLKRDRADKGRIYARAGIPSYWILNLTERQLEVYTRPAEGGWQETRTYAENDSVSLLLDGVEVGQVRVGDMLP